MGRIGPFAGQIAYHAGIRHLAPRGLGGTASVVSPGPRREPRRLTTTQHTPETAPHPWSGRLRRSKLRQPELPASVLPRPRLLGRIDDGRCPLTLIVAPAGFGKTTAAAAWASQEPHAAWLTADAADASLPRFWAHLREAIGDVTPGFGELVAEAFTVPYRAPAVDLGRLLADELLDAAMPVRLVIDDFHLVPASETHAFLDGLLEIAPPGFHLLIAARHEPSLDLTRLRLRGEVRELRGGDLLFTAEETQLLDARVGSGATPGRHHGYGRHYGCRGAKRGGRGGTALARRAAGRNACQPLARGTVGTRLRGVTGSLRCSSRLGGDRCRRCGGVRRGCDPLRPRGRSVSPLAELRR